MNELLDGMLAMSPADPQIEQEDNQSQPNHDPDHAEDQVVQGLAKKCKKCLVQAAVATAGADAYGMQEEHD
nr:hypothetical protein [uncultured Pseudoxanthomonas sp.]